jgi:hypothetical protein
MGFKSAFKGLMKDGEMDVLSRRTVHTLMMMINEAV